MSRDEGLREEDLAIYGQQYYTSVLRLQPVTCFESDLSADSSILVDFTSYLLLTFSFIPPSFSLSLSILSQTFPLLPSLHSSLPLSSPLPSGTTLSAACCEITLGINGDEKYPDDKIDILERAGYG